MSICSAIKELSKRIEKIKKLKKIINFFLTIKIKTLKCKNHKHSTKNKRKIKL